MTLIILWCKMLFSRKLYHMGGGEGALDPLRQGGGVMAGPQHNNSTSPHNHLGCGVDLQELQQLCGALQAFCPTLVGVVVICGPLQMGPARGPLGSEQTGAGVRVRGGIQESLHI